MVNRNLETAKNAFAAARVKDPTKNSTTIVKEYGISRSIYTTARLVLEFGTPEQIRAAENAEVGIRSMADQIRDSLTPEQRREYQSRRYNKPVWTAERRGSHIEEASFWAKFGSALKVLTEMPNQLDLINNVLKRNAMREASVDQYLETATNWLEEFRNEWRKYKQSKGGHVDSGGGD